MKPALMKLEYLKSRREECKKMKARTVFSETEHVFRVRRVTL